MPDLSSALRRAKSLLWTALSILIVVAAVLVGFGKLLMPYSDRYQPRLEAWLSKEFDRPVELDSFEGEWTAFGPRLTLRGMKLMPSGEAGESPGGAEVAIESAALDIKPLNWLLPGYPLYNFRVIGARFELTRAADGQFTLSGFGVSRRGGGQPSALQELARVGEVVLENSRLHFRDEIHGIDLSLHEIHGRLQLEGNELSSEVRARLYDERSDLVFGDVEATVQLSLGEDQRLQNARWQATTRELMLAALQGRLPPNPFLPLSGWLNAELWGNWSKADGHRVSGVTDLKEARLVNDYQDLWLERVNTRFRWRSSGGKHWSLHFADFLYDDGEQSWTAPRVSLARNIAGNLGLWISADRLPLDFPLGLARDIMSMYETPWPSALPVVADGQVSDLDLVLDAGWKLQLARGEVAGASVGQWGRWPALHGLDASVELGSNSGRVDLSGDRVVMDWPRVFREPLALNLPPCRVAADWDAQWQVAVDGCTVENEDLAAHGGIIIRSNTGKPSVDLNVKLSRVRVGQLAPYWPESVLKEPVKAWLRRGLKGGEITSGRVQLRGDLDDFPFRGGEGRFEAVAQVVDGRLDFLAGWPEAKSLEATVRFVDASMDIRGHAGEIGGVGISEARAVIPEFAKPVLVLDYAADSSIPALLDFVQRTPLREHIGTDLDRFTFAGPAKTAGRLEFTFGSEDALSLAGRVELRDGRFAEPEHEFVIDGIVGRLDYSERGFRAARLQAEYEGKPAWLSVTADIEAAAAFRAELEGEFTAADVAPDFLDDDLGLLDRASGEAHWQLSVVVERRADGAAPPVLQLVSDLRGISLDLPAPLAKPAGRVWPFRLRYPLAGAGRSLEVAVGDRLAMAFDLPEGADAPRAVAVRLGSRRAPLPAPGQVRVDGNARSLDLDGWLGLVIDEAGRGRDLGGLVLEPMHVNAAELHFLDRRFDEVAIELSAEASEISAAFTGREIDGNVRFTAGAGGMNSLSAEFRRLALGEPLSTGVDVQTDPADLPALHLYAESLRYAGIELGETRIEAYPISNGFHFEKVEARSGRLSLEAKGDWLLDEDGHRSDFNIRMASESLGDFLQSMDIASPVQGGQTLVYFNAWWPGSPAAFGLSRLNGEVEFSVVDGNIANASAGTGRLLGLLSVQALPKRLALDFRDVFDSGFSFDEASGSFEMENGTATTDNVLLRSTAASISVSGRTDLVGREYDQLMTIRPGVGNTLPIIGALAAGPGGAAAGLALQGLLHNSLGEATQVRYSITGPWEDPRIEAVDVERQGG